MSGQLVEQLFEEFAIAYRRGEAPDVGDFLARAGPESEDLGRMLDRFLQAVPAREPTEEEVVLMQARAEQAPPLLVLRLRRALSRDAVVDALMRALVLDAAKREKVSGYYHELEVGTLDPKPVSSRVWDALGEFMSANVHVLAGLRLPPPLPEGAVFRRLELHERVSYLASWDVAEPVKAEPEAALEREERDEVDRLFLGPERR